MMCSQHLPKPVRNEGLYTQYGTLDQSQYNALERLTARNLLLFLDLDEFKIYDQQAKEYECKEVAHEAYRDPSAINISVQYGV
jgi:hypothetical protein